MKIEKFGGINNKKAPERLGRSESGVFELREAENVDIDESYRIARRKGFASVYSGTNVHSLWATKDGATALFVEGGDLYNLNTDYTKTLLRSGLTPSQRMSYAEVNGDIYYSDGLYNGIISGGVNRIWGVEVPTVQPALVAVAGGLDSGDYQVTITYQRTDGEESGAGVSTSITLATTGGISLTGIPTSADSNVAFVNIYCTPANGDIMYFVAQITNGTATHTVANSITTSYPLKTQFVTPPPVGGLIEHHYGRMYVAVGNAVYISDPMAFGHFRLSTNYIQFPEDVTLMGSVINGMYISADKTYYQRGSKPLEASLVIATESKAVKHTMARTDGRKIEGINEGPALMWTSDRGVYAASGDGLLRNLTDGNWSFDPSETGAGLVREHDGNTHYIGLLKDSNKTANNAHVGDIATAEVIRQNV